MNAWKNWLGVGIVGIAASAWAESAKYEVIVNVGDADVTWDSTSHSGVVALMGKGADCTLVKKGGGRLTIECDLKALGYKGEIRVKEGFLRLRHDGACGTTDAGVVVAAARIEGALTLDSSFADGKWSLAQKAGTIAFGAVRGFVVNLR